MLPVEGENGRLPGAGWVPVAEAANVRRATEEPPWARRLIIGTAMGFLERAERIPRLDTLLTISKGFGISVSELLEGLEKRSQTILRKPGQRHSS